MIKSSVGLGVASLRDRFCGNSLVAGEWYRSPVGLHLDRRGPKEKELSSEGCGVQVNKGYRGEKPDVCSPFIPRPLTLSPGSYLNLTLPSCRPCLDSFLTLSSIPLPLFIPVFIGHLIYKRSLPLQCGRHRQGPGPPSI